MKILFYIIILSVFFAALCSSCAAVFNKRTTVFSVRTSAPATLKLGDSTVMTSEEVVAIPGDPAGLTIHSATFEVLRRGKPLYLDVDSEFPTQTLKIPSRLSSQVWFNPLTYFYGTGLLFDLPFPRSYEYPNRWFDLESGKTGRIRKNRNPYLLTRQERKEIRENPNYKGRFDLTFTLSPFNTSWTYMNLDRGHDNYSGSFGLSLGAEYFYTDKRSLAIEVNRPSSTNIFLVLMPILRPFGDEHPRKSWQVSLYDNIHLDDFSFGYGINLANNRYKEWLKDEYDEIIYPRSSLREHHLGIGPMVNAYYKAGQGTRFGLSYRTSLYRFDTSPAWKYEHVIALDMKFNIRLSRK